MKGSNGASDDDFDTMARWTCTTTRGSIRRSVLTYLELWEWHHNQPIIFGKWHPLFCYLLPSTNPYSITLFSHCIGDVFNTGVLIQELTDGYFVRESEVFVTGV